MGQAAYEKKVAVSPAPPDGESFANLPAVSSAMNHAGDVLDDTDMVLASGHADFGTRSRILGLRDASVTMTLNYTSGNTEIILLRDAWRDKLEVLIRYLPDGTTANGFEMLGIVESFSITADINGLVTVDVTIQATGLVIAA